MVDGFGVALLAVFCIGMAIGAIAGLSGTSAETVCENTWPGSIVHNGKCVMPAEVSK